MDRTALDIRDSVAGVLFVPAAVEVLGDQAELNDQNVGQVGGGDLTSLFLPQPRTGTSRPCP